MLELADDNLRLAVVAALLERGLLPPFDKAAWRAAHPASADPDRDDAIDWRGASRGPPDEEGAEEDYRDFFGSRELLRALAGTEVDARLAAAVEELAWDDFAGGEVRHLAWTYWDGEDETFDVRFLAGLEQLPNLRRLSLRLLCAERLDLAPLAGHPALCELALGCRAEDYRPLLAIPRLARVAVRGLTDPAQAGVAGALRARGVEVAG